MMTSSIRRQMKNMVNNYTEAEVKVREATSNDPWDPPGPLMEEISDLTFNAVAFPEVMGVIWKRLNDHGRNWRHVYKALTLLEYLVKTGSDRVGSQCRENVVALQTLRDFQHVDRDGRDQGCMVREKAKQLVALLRDEDRLKRARSQSLKPRERPIDPAAMPECGSSYGDLPPPYPGRRSSQPVMSSSYVGEGARGSPSVSSSFSSPRCHSYLEEARPQSTGEEELQLQLALAMSQEESGKKPPPVNLDEQTQLQLALNLSKEEPIQPIPPISTIRELDEDAQLQLALSLSKAAHQEEERSREGEETLLRKALEESRREVEGGGVESAMKDLEDIFGAGPAATPRVDPWDLPPTGVNPAIVVTSDPWDPLGDPSTIPAASGALKPWDPNEPPLDTWDTPRNNSSIHTGSSGVDPFCTETKESRIPYDSPRRTLSRSGSPTDGDLFGELEMGRQVNGREQGSPLFFDLSGLREGLADPAPQTSRTPESFLDPTEASLVNLDSLIPLNPPAKISNPFLTTELSATTTPNPFQSEQPRLTLNQLRSDSPSSLTSNSSLPPSVSVQPPILPTSFAQPPTYPPSQGLLDGMPCLPQPLLPFSTAPTPGQQGDQQAENPFL